MKIIPLLILALTALDGSIVLADTPGDVPARTYVTAPQGSLSLSGAVYLYGYEPAFSGASDSFDLYAFILNMDGASPDRRTGIHAQLRYRDDRLRSFYTSNVWFQELYVYRKTDWGDFHAGKFYRKVGILWDDSFFGNVEYFNGLMLDPNYGVEWVGTRDVSSGLNLDYSAQFFPNNGDTDGSLPGRDVDSDPNAAMRNTATFRFLPTWSFGKGKSIAVGFSGLNGSLQSASAANGNYDINQWAGDATLTWGPSTSYAEVLHQNGELDDARHPLSRPGYDSAVYLLAGTCWQIHPGVNARFNYSSADYAGQNAREEEYVPGVVVGLAKNLYLIAEFDYWRILPRGGPQTLVDRSVNTILHYDF